MMRALNSFSLPRNYTSSHSLQLQIDSAPDALKCDSGLPNGWTILVCANLLKWVSIAANHCYKTRRSWGNIAFLLQTNLPYLVGGSVT
jgi:hypothetical protein